MARLPGRAQFPTTHWSRVVRAGTTDSPEARADLADLCEHYWYPIYALIRRKGNGPEEALDLAQDYFTRLIEKGVLAKVDSQKGRFRSFLMVDCGYFLSDCHERALARKRGGGNRFESIDARDAEGRFLREPAHEETPERLFERDWAITLIERASGQLERHYARTGRLELFGRLKAIVSAAPDAGLYAEIAADLGLAEGSVRVAAYRFRARLAAALREEIAATIDQKDRVGVDDELRSLLASLGT